jgi:polyferredoxin
LAHRSGSKTGWRTKPWTTLRKIVQAVTLILFTILFIASRRGGWAPALVNIPIRLDPLAMLANILANRAFLAGSSLAILTILLTLAAGRAWCGWLCPLGTLIDLFSLKRLRTALASGKDTRPRLQDPPESWRRFKYGLLISILTAALLSNLSLLVFDPLTILFRSLTVSFWPAVDQALTAVETVLYPVPWLQPALTSLDSWIRPAILPVEPAFYRDAVLYGLVFCSVIAFNLAAERFWCRYLCPLGGLLGLLSKVSLLRRKVGDECKGCVLCSRACPTGTIDADKGYASDPSECTMCLECMEACPRSGIRFPINTGIAQWNHYDPSRREALLTIGAAIAGVALLGSESFARRDDPHLVRPPGARENNLLDKCIRCGECLRACPTSGLQPSLYESGLEGLWTPILMPRLGYCDFSCNACGQVCPVQAIPALTLDEKRQQVIGKAYIDENRCIAWADHRECLVCEEMCPLPDKAIKLDQAQVKTADGEEVSVKLPKINRDRCIGCGVCEYKCPVNGEAAIRVYAPADSQLYG